MQLSIRVVVDDVDDEENGSGSAPHLDAGGKLATSMLIDEAVPFLLLLENCWCFVVDAVVFRKTIHSTA